MSVQSSNLCGICKTKVVHCRCSELFLFFVVYFTGNPMQETVSIIITVLNGEKWIDKCFESIAKQSAVGQQRTPTTPRLPADDSSPNGIHIEVCVFDDASVDNTAGLLQKWKRKLESIGVDVVILKNSTGRPKGVGYGRNKAIGKASGAYLCFQDIDDEMLPNRISKQLLLAKHDKNAIVGCKFIRIPANSTCRFSRWANELEQKKLSVQVYTSHGPTVIMPTWLCHRSVFSRVGGFCESGKGTPEDLIFFYEHLDRGGTIQRVDEILLRYRYHPDATTFSITESTIWKIRLQRLIGKVLCTEPWRSGFTIWNAGKQGRRFFRDLPDDFKSSVRALCDVDKNKINSIYQYFDEGQRKITHAVPIVHFSDAKPPLLICMKLDLTHGVFEANLRSLNLIEGVDYILFS